MSSGFTIVYKMRVLKKEAHRKISMVWRRDREYSVGDYAQARVRKDQRAWLYGTLDVMLLLFPQSEPA